MFVAFRRLNETMISFRSGKLDGFADLQDMISTGKSALKGSQGVRPAVVR